MAVSNVQSPSNGGTTDFDLSLKIFSGMILAEFDDMVHTMDKHRVGEMEAGADSIQFPALGDIGVSYHTPGESVLTDQDASAAD